MMCARLHVRHSVSEPCGVPPLTLMVTMTVSFLRSAPALRVVLQVWKHTRNGDSRRMQNSRENAAHLEVPEEKWAS